MSPTTCFAYLENKVLPGEGLGGCLMLNEPQKDTQGVTTLWCRKCSDVLEERRCPREHTSPYLKEGEKS